MNAQQAGYKGIIAIIVALDIFTQLSVADIMDNVKEDVCMIKYFDNITDARRWIATQ